MLLHWSFWFQSEKVSEMDEIDFDYEKPSLSLFQERFSGSNDSEHKD